MVKSDKWSLRRRLVACHHTRFIIFFFFFILLFLFGVGFGLSFQKYYTLSGMLGLNGYHVVQTFFMISGLLMGLAFKDIYDKKTFKLSYFGIVTFYRYIR